jgi:hypothetical protein
MRTTTCLASRYVEPGAASMAAARWMEARRVAASKRN